MKTGWHITTGRKKESASDDLCCPPDHQRIGSGCSGITRSSNENLAQNRIYAKQMIAPGRLAAHFSLGAVCEELDGRCGVAPGFERVEALLALLGDPHKGMRSVQVVGTSYGAFRCVRCRDRTLGKGAPTLEGESNLSEHDLDGISKRQFVGNAQEVGGKWMAGAIEKYVPVHTNSFETGWIRGWL